MSPTADDPAEESLAETAELFIGSVARLATALGMSEEDVGRFDSATASSLPEDYRTLLAHTGHMTVTLEAFHNTLVDVRVLKELSSGSSYSREILLTRQSDGAVVQYGLVRIWLSDLPDEVRTEIEDRKTPLGRVLIRHGLLRDVELLSFWKIVPSEALRQHLGAGSDETVYGRSAQILLDGRPTVQLLEIVRVP